MKVKIKDKGICPHCEGSVYHEIYYIEYNEYDEKGKMIGTGITYLIDSEVIFCKNCKTRFVSMPSQPEKKEQT